jgi:hypothetical protein
MRGVSVLCVWYGILTHHTGLGVGGQTFAPSSEVFHQSTTTASAKGLLSQQASSQMGARCASLSYPGQARAGDHTNFLQGRGGEQKCNAR